jgi:exosome complex component RRP42
LCIKEGEKVWTVFIDIYTINDDGNCLDAAGIGAIAALKSARIPKYDEKEEKVCFGEWTDKKIPLKKEIPISITAYKIGNNFIVDPTREEAGVSEARLTIASSDGIIFSMQKGDMKEIKVEEFHDMLDLINKAEREIFKKLERHFK